MPFVGKSKTRKEAGKDAAWGAAKGAGKAAAKSSAKHAMYALAAVAGGATVVGFAPVVVPAILTAAIVGAAGRGLQIAGGQLVAAAKATYIFNLQRVHNHLALIEERGFSLQGGDIVILKSFKSGPVEILKHPHVFARNVRRNGACFAGAQAGICTERGSPKIIRWDKTFDVEEVDIGDMPFIAFRPRARLGHFELNALDERDRIVLEDLDRLGSRKVGRGRYETSAQYVLQQLWNAARLKGRLQKYSTHLDGYKLLDHIRHDGAVKMEIADFEHMMWHSDGYEFLGRGERNAQEGLPEDLYGLVKGHAAGSDRPDIAGPPQASSVSGSRSGSSMSSSGQGDALACRVVPGSRSSSSTRSGSSTGSSTGSGSATGSSTGSGSATGSDSSGG